MNRALLVLLMPGVLCATLCADDRLAGDKSDTVPRRVFTTNGLPADDKFFPIAVWLQSPANAARYKAAGINLYLGLWDGPSRQQLAELQKAGMPVICEQNQFALENLDNPLFAGWMHGDEPDNAQSLGSGKGYGPPVPPADIIRDYHHIHAADPSRPVVLNLGQGVAWDDYVGRGVRRNHPGDYAEYASGCDIASFDIYPVVHDSPQIAGKLEFVAKGVERLVNWTSGEKPVWTCIECTHIGNPAAIATPQQVRSEVWMGLIRGARGIIYFVHQFKPAFREAALMDDAEMLQAVTAINRQIGELAPVLNSATIQDNLNLRQDNGGQVIAMMKHHDKSTYIFAVNLRNQHSHTSFTLKTSHAGNTGDVLAEKRSIAIRAGTFEEDFQPYEVHLYRIPDAN